MYHKAKQFEFPFSETIDMQTKKSSAEWQRILDDIIVLDPDGWDRNNFDKSWNELITQNEYIERRIRSTVMGNPNKKVNPFRKD